ncbi:MAG TPA: sodium-dependent transporter [Gemmatimonadota bacterium]|nr:sodium-dependent transporter [Gemmatimonadota bacterium]
MAFQDPSTTSIVGAAGGRETWGTRIGLILAMAGNAVGLGNFLRFPVQAAENGGGAFMIPYFISLLLLGIPLMWVEWSLGRYGGVRGHGSTPGILDAIWKSPVAKYLGALGIFMPFIVMVYYTYVESWSLGFSLLSLVGAFNQAEGIEGMSSFLRAYQGAEIHATGMFGNVDFGWFIFPTMAYGFFLITMALNLYFLYRGVRGGIEKVALYALPALFLFAVILMVRVLTLGTPDPTQPENSVMNGLAFIWNPNLTALGDPGVWLAAAGQIFFTLSLGMGSIHCYASYLRNKDDVALSGLSTAATNETAEVVLGGTIAIPAAVAFFGVAATMQLAAGGAFNLGFVTLPVIFQQIPAGSLFGALWFFLLFIAGITSSLAMGQVVIAFLEDEFGMPRKRAVLILGALVFVCVQPVVLFIEHGYMDELDFWAGTFGLFVFGAIEIILFSWVFGIDRGWREINLGADIRPPRIFKFILAWVTPVLMIGIFIAWTLQSAIDTALMQGVEESTRPFVLGARLFMLAVLGGLLYLIRRAWRSRRAARPA